jgi:hypothetical protein
MPTLPSSLLQRFYERNSLCNNDSGYELTIRNSVAPSTLLGVGPLVIDGLTVGPEQLECRLERPPVRHGRQPEPLVRAGDAISPAKALRFDLDVVLRVVVYGQRLPAGEHRFALHLRTKEVGDIIVEASDHLAEELTPNGSVR